VATKVKAYVDMIIQFHVRTNVIRYVDMIIQFLFSLYLLPGVVSNSSSPRWTLPLRFACRLMLLCSVRKVWQLFPHLSLKACAESLARSRILKGGHVFRLPTSSSVWHRSLVGLVVNDIKTLPESFASCYFKLTLPRVQFVIFQFVLSQIILELHNLLM
jgi:hypothetical protein